MLTHVYIASLGHSGSTILGIALGAVQGGVSIGELDATVRRLEEPQHSCTCGAAAAACPVWGPLFAGADTEIAAEERYTWGYRTLYDGLQRCAGQYRYMVDTSKDVKALRAIPSTASVSLKVVFLVKDPRSYFLSHYRKWLAVRNAQRGIPGVPRRSRRRRAPLFVLELGVALLNWWWGNRRILRILRDGKYDYFILSYDEMVLDTSAVEARLSLFLDTPVSLESIPLRSEQRHILRGNALRHSPERSSRLRYDYRWFYDPWVRRLGPFFALLLRWGLRKGLLPSRDT